MKDRQTGAVERVSVTTAGVQADAPSSSPRISSNGRFVVFVTAAALVADDTNSCAVTTGGPVGPCPDVYIHDRQTHETTRVSLDENGGQADRASVTADVSGDGRYVVFATVAGLALSLPDNDGLADIYRRDRQAGATVLVSFDSILGEVSKGAFLDPRISDDGNTVGFRSTATDLDPPCTAFGNRCGFGYVWRYTPALLRGRVTQLDLTEYRGSGPSEVTALTLSADGGTIALNVESARPGHLQDQTMLLLDLDGATLVLRRGTTPGYTIALNDSGRLNVIFPGFVQPAQVWDVTLGTQAPFALDCGSAAFAGSRFVAFASSDTNLVTGDTNGAWDIFVFDRDPDTDGMPSEWETKVGLDPAVTDASGDADGDSVSNLVEYQAGTHPRGTYMRYLAEGAQTTFFTTFIDVFNPGTVAARVVLRLLGEGGGSTSLPMVIPPKTAVSTYPSTTELSMDFAAFGSAVAHATTPSFSAVVESDQVVAVERAMTWGYGAEGAGWYGSHAESGIPAPQTTWYFAEGATAGNFDLFYLLQNPTSAPANVTITYLRPAPLAPIVGHYVVSPNTRRTIQVDAEPGLASAEISATIASDQPILAERAMYLSRPDEVFAGGTAGAGLPSPALEWFIPEGATGTFFDLYVLVANPGNSEAQLQVAYLLPNGASFTKPYAVGAQSRLTISVKGEDARLAATAVSIVVTSMNNVPVVVERAMWWPSGDWYEGHVSAATTATSPRWALARGAVAQRLPEAGLPENRTYILIANPSADAANVTLDLAAPATFDRAAPLTCRRTIAVAARSRATFDLAAACDFTPTQLGIAINLFAGTISSDGPGIVVERSTYVSSTTRIWTAGESTLLTRLP